MTITQLQYVLAVAEHKNFTLAAEKCFVTQPTLSMQIQKLDEELEVQIFDRIKKPIQLTDIGLKIVNQAKNIVNEANRIQDIVEFEKGFVGGDFRLGIIPTIMPTLLPMFLGNFTKKYPKVKLIIEELNTDEIISRLNKGHLDAAIAATPLDEPKIKEIVLYYEPFVAYIPSQHPLSSKSEVTSDDIENEELLLLKDGHCFRDGVLNFCKNSNTSQSRNFELASGSFETLLKLSDEGLGLTLLPYLHSLELSDKNKLKIKSFPDPKPAREVSLIYPKSELKLHLIDALRHTIEGVVRGAIVFQNVQIISPKSKK